MCANLFTALMLSHFGSRTATRMLAGNIYYCTKSLPGLYIFIRKIARLRGKGPRWRHLYFRPEKGERRPVGLREAASWRLFLAAENFGQVFAQADKGQCRWQSPRFGDYRAVADIQVVVFRLETGVKDIANLDGTAGMGGKVPAVEDAFRTRVLQDFPRPRRAAQQFLPVLFGQPFTHPTAVRNTPPQRVLRFNHNAQHLSLGKHAVEPEYLRRKQHVQQ